MNQEMKTKISEFLLEFPLYQYAFFSPTELEFSQKVRQICKEECPRYGESWSCPPGTGEIFECKNHCLSYSDALLITSVAEVEDSMNLEESLATKMEHEILTNQIRDYLCEQDFDTFVISTDSCCLCEVCAYPEHPCIHPASMHPCIESQGIVLVNLLEKLELDSYLSNQQILWFSILFLKTHILK